MLSTILAASTFCIAMVADQVSGCASCYGHDLYNTTVCGPGPSGPCDDVDTQIATPGVNYSTSEDWVALVATVPITCIPNVVHISLGLVDAVEPVPFPDYTINLHNIILGAQTRWPGAEVWITPPPLNTEPIDPQNPGEQVLALIDYTAAINSILESTSAKQGLGYNAYIYFPTLWNSGAQIPEPVGSEWLRQSFVKRIQKATPVPSPSLTMGLLAGVAWVAFLGRRSL